MLFASRPSHVAPFRNWIAVLVGVFLGADGSNLIGEELGPGTFSGLLGNVHHAGVFDLVESSEGRLVGEFRTVGTTPARDFSWEASIEIEAQEDGSWTLRFQGSPVFADDQCSLRQFETPCGMAWMGAFSYPSDGHIFSGRVGIWLDRSLNPKELACRPRVSPQLEIRGGGRFRRWGSEPVGLASDSTRSMFVASDGYLWIGTTDGISRFDGLTWKTFNPDTAPSLPGWNCRGLSEDAEGNLIVMLKHHGFFRHRAGVWEPFACNPYLENTVPGGLSRDESGNLWFSYDSDRIGRIDPQERLTSWGAEELVLLRDPDASHLNRIHHVGQFMDGAVVSTPQGIRPVDLSGERLPYWIEPRAGDLAWVHNASDGTLWVTSLSVVIHYDTDGRVIDVYFPRPHTGTLRCAFPRRNGGLWVIGSRGLFLMPSPSRIVHFSDFPEEMCHAVTKVFEGEGGSIWMANGGHGLCSFQPFAVEPTSLPESSDAERNVHTRTVSLGLDHRGAPMVARRAMVSGLEESGWSLPETQKGLEHRAVGAGSVREPDVWWAGVVPRLDHRERAIQGEVPTPIPVAARIEGDRVSYITMSSLPLGLRDVRSLLWVEGSGVWLGTDEGLLVCRPEEEPVWSGGVDLPQFPITAMVSGKDGRVWVASSEQGLYRVSTETGIVDRYSVEDGALPSNRLASLSWARDGSLWCAGPDGVFAFDPAVERAVAVLTGNLSASVHSVLEDRDGNLWAGVASGVFALPAERVRQWRSDPTGELVWFRFGLYDGFSNPSAESGYSPGMVQSKDGTVYICMHNELMQFEPDALLQTLSAGPQMKMEAIGDGETKVWQAEVGMRPESPKIVLESGAGDHVRIDFGSLYFSEPELLKFRYRLANRSSAWTEIENQRSVWLFDLAPGDYEFEVEGWDKNNVFSPEPARLQFQVLPHFYQTGIFRLGGMLGILALGYGVHRSRIRRTLREEDLKARLRLEADRRRIAHDVHDEIGASFAQMKILGELVEQGRTKGQAINDTVSRIVTLARGGSQTLREILWALQAGGGVEEELPEFLGSTLEDLFDGSGIRFVYQQEWSGEIPTLSPSFKRDLVLVAKGVASNVIRHSEAKVFRCELFGEGPRVRLRFVDDGIGFDPQAVRGDSLGMQSIRERVARWDGTFALETAADRGVRIDVSLDSRASDDANSLS